MFTCQNKIHPIRGVRRVENRCDVFFIDINPPPCLKACPASTPLPRGELKHGPHQSHPSYFIYTAMKVPARAELAGLSLTYSITKGTSCSILPHDQPFRHQEGTRRVVPPSCSCQLAIMGHMNSFWTAYGFGGSEYHTPSPALVFFSADAQGLHSTGGSVIPTHVARSSRSWPSLC